MSDVEDPVEEAPQEGESGQPKYRSYEKKAKTQAKAKQQFRIGRTVWFKTDNGSYVMTIEDAVRDPVLNTWSYKLKDSNGEDHEGWVAEEKLSAANPRSK